MTCAVTPAWTRIAVGRADFERATPIDHDRVCLEPRIPIGRKTQCAIHTDGIHGPASYAEMVTWTPVGINTREVLPGKVPVDQV